MEKTETDVYGKSANCDASKIRRSEHENATDLSLRNNSRSTPKHQRREVI